MKAPSFASILAVAAVIAGISFVAVGATRLDNQTSKAILRERGLPAAHELITRAREARICIETAGPQALRVTGPGGPEAARSRDPELFEQIGRAADLINWYEIRC